MDSAIRPCPSVLCLLSEVGLPGTDLSVDQQHQHHADDIGLLGHPRGELGLNSGERVGGTS